MHKVARKAAWAMLDGVGDRKRTHVETDRALGIGVHYRRAMTPDEQARLPPHPDRPNA